MTVSESRVGFWAASIPNTFHEMTTSTVPTAVIDALSRTGSTAGEVSWGVTLPGKMTIQLDELMQAHRQLDELMQAHRGGSLIIDAGGDIHWEAK
jgi:hypothetical protein